MMYLFNTNMLINLKKTESELWDQLTQSLRTDIRKSIKNWLYVKRSISEEEFNECCILYLSMMKRVFVPVLKDYKKYLENKKVLLIKKDHKVVSYMFFNDYSNIDKLWKTKIAAFENTATSDSYKQFSPNSLLYWESIKYMKELWFEFLSFTGCDYQYWDNSLKRLAFFKKKWNWLEVQSVWRKTIFGYIYWRWFRKYDFIKKIVYFLLTNIFRYKYLKY